MIHHYIEFVTLISLCLVYNWCLGALLHPPQPATTTTTTTISKRVTKGEEEALQTFYSADAVVGIDKLRLPPEFLNSISMPEKLPEHNLKLKVGTEVILMKDAHYSMGGFSIGTKLVITRILSSVSLMAMVAEGVYVGNEMPFCRFDFNVFVPYLHITLCRRQFPFAVVVVV